ncbi:MAG: DUF3798 domain-containing protein [Clostridia bacterium]|nr:DUF3798 domain-containing protein [Clostridia bacterium]
MKKILCLALALVLCLALACGAVAEENWKIAILTGTTSQGEEEVRAAERAIATYGADHIIHDTYPDAFASETETTISKLVAFASDPDVKAVVMCQAVPGAKAGFDKIREMRPDILLVAGVPQEDPNVITAAADIVLYSDEPGQGDTIIETCANWGVEVFVHYSFPRHLAMETIAARKALFESNCEALGIQYVEATAPDPTGDAGTAGAQQFILEDVPLKMEEFAGKKVAFFSTNCSMQEPLQTAILTQPNAYYPQPCCPSPYHAFPASLGLEALQIGGDDTDALKQIAGKLVEYDAVGRYSTWPTPVNMAIIAVGVEYAKAYIDGEVTSVNDSAKIAELFETAAPGAKLANYTDANGTTYDNYYTILLGPVDFNDYLE